LKNRNGVLLAKDWLHRNFKRKQDVDLAIGFLREVEKRIK